MEKKEIEQKLNTLREEWKNNPHMRTIIQVRAKLLKNALKYNDDNHILSIDKLSNNPYNDNI